MPLAVLGDCLSGDLIFRLLNNISLFPWLIVSTLGGESDKHCAKARHAKGQTGA